jgi:hypothetical protein
MLANSYAGDPTPDRDKAWGVRLASPTHDLANEAALADNDTPCQFGDVPETSQLGQDTSLSSRRYVQMFTEA